MRKKIFIALGLLFSLSSVAQKINNSLFCNSKWFSPNKNNEFYQADTIKLLKKSKIQSGEHNQDHAEDLPDYYHGSNFLSINLKKGSEMNLTNTITDEWIIEQKKGNYTWTFDKKEKILKFFFEKKLIGEFSIVKIEKVSIKSKFANQSRLSSSEITLKRVSPVVRSVQ